MVWQEEPPRGCSRPAPQPGHIPPGSRVFVSLEQREGKEGDRIRSCPLPWHIDSLVSLLWLHRVLRALWGNSDGCWGSEWGVIPCGVGMRSKLVPGGSAVPQRTGRLQGVSEGAAAPHLPHPSISTCLRFWSGGCGRHCGWAALGYRPVPICRCGAPHPGRWLPAEGCASCGSAWLRSTPSPLRGDGGRGLILAWPSDPHPIGTPRGLAAVPALPCLRQRCRSLRSSHLPGASHPPLPAQGKRAGCWGYCQRQSPPVPLQVLPYPSCLL